MINVIIIQSIFAVIYLLIKKAVVCFYKENHENWDAIKDSYYWFEFTYFFTAAVLTPKHTLNEGVITLMSVIAIKVVFDRLTFIDKWMCEMFKK